MVEDSSSSSECNSTRQKITCKIKPGEPPEKEKKKRFHHLELVTEQKWKESLKKSSSLLPGRTEIERYFTTIESATDRVDPLEYWIELQFFWVKWQLIWWLFQCHLLPLRVFINCRWNMHWQVEQTSRWKFWERSDVKTEQTLSSDCVRS